MVTNKENLEEIDYKQDHHSCLRIVLILGSISILDLIISYYFGAITFKRVLLTTFLFSFFWPTYYQYLKKLQYSFWGLSIFLFLYLFLNLLSSLTQNDYPFHSQVMTFLFSLHAVLLYLASSPVYYPRVSWWEFDYRYRNDAPARIEFEKLSYDARVTDIRRKAGSFNSFKELKLGDSVRFKMTFKNEKYDLKGIIGYKTQRVLGRPFSYGFQFILKKEELPAYRRLDSDWKSREKVRIDQKFKKESTS